MSNTDMNLNCPSVQARLAASWGYVKPSAVRAGYFAYDAEHNIWKEVSSADAPGATALYMVSKQDPFAASGKPIVEPVKQGSVSVESAEKMGATGAAPTESERQLFEAWMRGHCWAVSGVWDGKTYVDSAETGGYINPHTMHTRCLWAAWRDRAALAAPVQPVKQEELNWGANKFMPHEQPVKQEPVRLQFPTMLRKMWSGTEVQQWLDEQVQPVKRPQNCGTGYCSCIECIHGKDSCVADEAQCNDGCLAQKSAIADALKLADELDIEFCQGRISNHNGRKAAQMLRMLADSPIQPLKQESAHYVDSTPHLHVGDSSFEDWYQSHPKASGGDKQLARDAYAAGMGDPLVAPVQPVKQEPVAWEYCPECGSLDVQHEEGNHKQCARCFQEWFSDVDYSDVVQQNLNRLYAAPVRTKDLTDDEIAKAVGSPLDEVYLADFRAVIAADREKNK